jgi:hypothetical protein
METYVAFAAARKENKTAWLLIWIHAAAWLTDPKKRASEERTREKPREERERDKPKKKQADQNYVEASGGTQGKQLRSKVNNSAPVATRCRRSCQIHWPPPVAPVQLTRSAGHLPLSLLPWPCAPPALLVHLPSLCFSSHTRRSWASCTHFRIYHLQSCM